MARLDETEYHIPVMLNECIAGLAMHESGVYIDATLGGGGHTAALLAQQPQTAKIIAFDADERAIAHTAMRFEAELAKAHSSRLTIVHANFSTMPQVVQNMNILADGVLFDLGVSSYQFDYHERGFSFRKMAPLDMRFAPSGETAADILNSRSEEELSAIFRANADEPQAWRLAKAIVQRRTLSRFATTADLRDVVVQQIPPQHQPKTMARLFQALRIAVNNELGVLEDTLVAMIPLLRIGARIVVMSYHSGEDRIVKNVFRTHSKSLRILTKKAVEATPEEVARNPRARSARLRIAERIVEQN